MMLGLTFGEVTLVGKKGPEWFFQVVELGQLPYEFVCNFNCTEPCLKLAKAFSL